MSISTDARQITTTTKYNVACDPHNSGLASINVAVANFDLHTTEQKAYIGPGVIETSGKRDVLLVGGLT